ncbi:MAG: NERD domain-containing protein [Clostridiales bacterium]|nr:NERD domain-containing protein [Clostridiales bacterium]
MGALKAVLIIAAVLLLLFLAFLIALKVKSSLDYDKVMRTAKRDKRFLGKLLSTQFSKGRYMLNVVLPYGPDGKDSGPVDAVVVSKGGIAIITAKYFSGKVVNPYRGDWTVTNAGNTWLFPNLFEKNADFIEAVKTVMRREKLYNIPIHNIVMFGSKNVKFSSKESTLLTPEQLMRYLHDIKNDKFLNGSQQKEVMRAFAKYRRRIVKRKTQLSDNRNLPAPEQGTEYRAEQIAERNSGQRADTASLTAPVRRSLKPAVQKSAQIETRK